MTMDFHQTMGVAGLLVASFLVHLCLSQNFYYKKDGDLYDIYYGPESIPGYQKMMSPKSFKNSFNNRGERPGQCQNLNFTCTENYPYSATYNFECEHDYQCPKCFKCCHPICFTHKVCQPIIMELTTPEQAEIIITSTTVPTTLSTKPTDSTMTSTTPKITSTSSQSTSEETTSNEYHSTISSVYTVTTKRTTETTPTTKQLPSTTQIVTISTSNQASTEKTSESKSSNTQAFTTSESEFTEKLSTKELLTTMPVTTNMTTDITSTKKQTTEGILTTHYEAVTTTIPTSSTSMLTTTSSDLTSEKQTTVGISTTHNEVLTTTVPVMTSTTSQSISTETSSALYPESTITEKTITTQKILTTTDETISTMNKSETIETTSILPVTSTTTTEILPSLAVAISNRKISTPLKSEDLEDTSNRTGTITTQILPAQEISVSTSLPDSERKGNNTNTEPSDVTSKTSQTNPSTSSVQTQKTFIQDSTVPELSTNIPKLAEPSMKINGTTIHTVTKSETTTSRQISTISGSLEILKSSLAPQTTTTKEQVSSVASLEIHDTYTESTSTVSSQEIQNVTAPMSKELITTTDQSLTITNKNIPPNSTTRFITSEETTTMESMYTAQSLETAMPWQESSYTSNKIDITPIAELRSSTSSLKNVTKITVDKTIPTTKITPYSTTEEDKETTTFESTYVANITENTPGLETITLSQKSSSTTGDTDVTLIAELRSSTFSYEAFKNASERAIGETAVTPNVNITGIMLNETTKKFGQASTQSSFPPRSEKSTSKTNLLSRISAGQGTTIFEKVVSTTVSTPSSKIANITDDEDLLSGSGSGDGNEDTEHPLREDDEDFVEGSGNDNLPSETFKVVEGRKVNETQNRTSFVLNIPTKKPLKVDLDQDDFDIDDSGEGREIWAITTELTEKANLDKEGVKDTKNGNIKILSGKEVDISETGSGQNPGTNTDNKQIFTKEPSTLSKTTIYNQEAIDKEGIENRANEINKISKKEMEKYTKKDSSQNYGTETDKKQIVVKKQTTQSSPAVYTNELSLNPVAQTIKITTEATEYQELKQVMSTTIPYNMGTTLDRSLFFPEEEKKLIPTQTVKEDSRSIEYDKNMTYGIAETILEGNKNSSVTNKETARKQKEFDKEVPYDDENDEEDDLGGSGSGDLDNAAYVETQ